MAFPPFTGNRLSTGFVFLLCSIFLLLPLAVWSADTLVEPTKASATPLDSLQTKAATDTLRTDSVAPKKKTQAIDQIVEYSALDSMVFLDGGVGKLYQSGSVRYGTIQLDAGYIQMDMDSNLLSAIAIKDTAGKMVGDPVFKEKGVDYKSKSLKYNYKTGKGLIYQAVTQQGEGYVVSGTTKKVEDDVLCMIDGKYTTCDNHEHPHFYLSLSKAKMKQGNWIVSGPAHLVMEDVDLPLFIPFGYFPFKGDYSSGFLMPTYGDELQRGFYLSNMGYYFAFNDYVDLALRADIYSKGSWGVKANSTYKKMYKYFGSFSGSYIETVHSEKVLPDYSKTKDIRVDWRHSQDSKANPFSSFSASVNFATSGYTRNDLASLYNNSAFSENQRSSSVNFTQRFPESPFTLSLNASINQISRDTTVSVSLPNLNIGMASIYPFKRKEVVGAERWYERIRMSYTGHMANSINSVKEYDFFQKSIVKDWRNGFMHSIPVSADFTLWDNLNVNASFSYNERWYTSSLDKSYDVTQSKVLTDTTWGFNRVWDYNASMGVSTRLYGIYTMNPKVFGNISEIRHVLSPNLSLNYHPDFGDKKYGYWDEYSYLDRKGNLQEVDYSRYSNGLYGVPSKGKNGSIQFSLDNNVEMKIRQETDTATNYKKVSLIDMFRVGASYNLAADSLNLSDIAVALRLRFGTLYTLNLSTSLQPYTYVLNSAGSPVRVNTTQFKKYGIPGRMSGVGTSFQYSLGNDSFKKLMGVFSRKKKDADAVEGEEGTESSATIKPSSKTAAPAVPSDPEAELYVPSKIPWNISFSYSLRYAQSTFNKQKLEYDYDFTQNLSMNGSLALTKKWNFTANTSYNFVTKKMEHLMCSFTRDLHCWSMTGSFIPVGNYKSYNITIAVKSSLLSDLKYEQHQNPRDNSIW